MKARLAHAFAESIREAGYPAPTGEETDLVDLSRDPRFGDWSSAAAFSIGKSVKKNPRDVAQELSNRMKEKTGAETCEVAGGGFVNLRLPAKIWHEELWRAYQTGPALGRNSGLEGRKILLEFVSANPTGPLHVGHGRNAAIGDALGRLLGAAGATLRREYYVNDIGGQIETLCASVLLSMGIETPMSQEPGVELYRGDHIDGLGERLRESPEESATVESFKAGRLPWAVLVATLAPGLVQAMLENIRKDLAEFRVPFDAWLHESRLQSQGAVREALAKLQEANLAYPKDGAVWFRSTQFGDEKDRVLVRETGVPTYFASDIAYHLEKAGGDWTEWVNIWGADHHGYIKRVAGALNAMGKDPERLKVILVQMVSLIRGGQRVEMSKRKGTYVTLREVLDEVGADAARFFYLMREADSQLDFDMDLAKTQSDKNPVYYVQYAHARVASLFRHATDRGQGSEVRDQEPGTRNQEPNLASLTSPAELDLIKWSTYFPWIVLGAAKAKEPHRIVFYLIDLVRKFHSYYNEQRIVTEDKEGSFARLVLCRVFGTVVKNGLEWIGVSAPEKM
ncbi:MAG: arginine--tRNA ligase [Nitrospirae bacterium]|nr:arginine--tRNA ligase [Nitrospirota bacterium]